MRSVISCFNPTLYKKDLTRFWPLWTVYTVVLLFQLPLGLISSTMYNANFDAARWAGRQPVIFVGGGAGLALAVGYGLVCAMAVWSYLYNHRAANLMHALPVRRETHFVTHTLAGVTFFVLPHAIVFVITLLAELACGAVNVANLAAALGCLTLMAFFFFCFATACAMLTGHILVLPAFFVIFNFLIVGMTYLVEWLGTFFLYGYSGGLSSAPILIWLTPIAAMVENFTYGYPVEENTQAIAGAQIDVRTDPIPHFEGVHVLGIYAAVGLVLLVVALLLYRRRHVETAGDVVAVPALRPVFLYCVGLCGSLAGGCVTYLYLGLSGLIFLLIALLVWGAIFYFAALMLLHKSFRVFKEGWWGCALTLAIVAALCGVLEVDLFGAETRVPDAAQVKSVSISGFDTYPLDDAAYFRAYHIEDPEAIAKAIAVHQAIVDGREEQWAWEEAHAESGGIVDDLMKLESVNIDYVLTDGTTLSRDYHSLFVEYSDLVDPTSLESQLTDLANDRTVMYGRYALEQLENFPLVGVILEDSTTFNSAVLRAEGSESDFEYFTPLYANPGADDLDLIQEKYYDEYGYYPDLSIIQEDLAAGITQGGVATEVEGGVFEGTVTELTLSDAHAAAITEAVLADFQAGRLGVRYLFNGAPERLENTCVMDLELVVRTSHEQLRQNADGSTEMVTYTSSDTITITLTPQATATIAALEAAGAFEDTGVTLITNSEARKPS